MTDEVLGDFDQRGSVMSEFESYERVIEGLKLAADGARNLTLLGESEDWDRLAAMFDSVRVAVSRHAKLNRPNDEIASQKMFGKSGLTPNEAHGRVRTGLKQASNAARQIAVCHRMDVTWSRYANAFDQLHDKAQELLRAKLVAAGLILPPGVRVQ